MNLRQQQHDLIYVLKVFSFPRKRKCVAWGRTTGRTVAWGANSARLPAKPSVGLLLGCKG